MRAFPLSPTGPGVREPWGFRALGGRCGMLGPRDGEDLPKGQLQEPRAEAGLGASTGLLLCPILGPPSGQSQRPGWWP